MSTPKPAPAHNTAPPPALPHEPATVYFMPTQNFTASTDGVEPALYIAGKDEHGDPLVYPVPRHQAKDWQDRYKWGHIVDVRAVVKGTVLPAVPPVPPGEQSEVVSAPTMTDPSLRAAQVTAEATAQAVAASQPNSSAASAAGTSAPVPPRADDTKAGPGARGAPGKTTSKPGAKK